MSALKIWKHKLIQFKILRVRIKNAGDGINTTITKDFKNQNNRSKVF